MESRAYKILVADEEPFIKDTLKINLRSKGYEVVAVDSGRDMVRVAGRELPDLILSEINFKDLDTFRACQILKGNPRTQNIPIVALTRDVDSPDKKFMFGPYIERFIAKPFSPRQVAGAIREILTGKAASK